jgi:hypothetical protein
MEMAAAFPCEPALDLHVSDENLAVGKVERFDAENQKAVTRGLREVILGKILGEIRGKRGGRRVVVAGHHAILHRGTIGNSKPQLKLSETERERKSSGWNVEGLKGALCVSCSHGHGPPAPVLLEPPAGCHFGLHYAGRDRWRCPVAVASYCCCLVWC